jgi:hypothetical protein
VEIQGGAQEEIRFVLGGSSGLMGGAPGLRWWLTKAGCIGLQGGGGPRMGGAVATQQDAHASGGASVLPTGKGGGKGSSVGVR